MTNWLGPRGRRLVGLVLTLIVFFTLMRVAFFALFQHTSNGFTASELASAFYLGGKFDLRLALLLSLPLALLMWLPWLNPVRSARATRFWQGFYTVVGTVAFGFFLADFGYYAYLQSRINATFFHFFHNPLISAEMVWQTYPVVWGTLGVAVFAAAFFWTLRHLALPQHKGPIPTLSRKHKAIVGVAMSFAVLLGLYGRLAQYPLRWSEAFFSTDRFVSALGLNPIHYIFDTLENSSEEFDKKKTKRYYEAVSSYLGVDQPNKEKLNFARAIRPTPIANKDTNVVVIVMESMASYKTGVQGHPMDPTPYFDKVAREGVLFNQFYTPTEATARSMFCLVTGIPDVNPHTSSSRNPLIVNQNTVMNALADHEKYYFIGGSASWGNIRGVFSYNIPGIQIIEEGMYESPRTDVWGVSDLDLFKEAHRMLEERESDKPFFAVIQSAGFHRPYTIPENKDGFQLEKLSEEELNKYGFVSNEEYNSLRFADYSLGRFFELAKKSEYFDNTLFVITGDHGLPDNQAQHVSEGRKEHGLERFHVPLVFYAPKILKEPKVIEKIATEPDIMPTIAGMTGHTFNNTTLGRNLFDERFDDQRYAFFYVYYNQNIGLLTDEFYIKGHGDKVDGLYRYKSDQPNIDVSQDHTEKLEKMKSLMFGLHQTSKYLLYNNPNQFKPRISHAKAKDKEKTKDL